MSKSKKNRLANYLPFQTVATLKDRLMWYINLRWIAIIGIIIAVPIAGKMLDLKIGYNEIINTSVVLFGINIIYVLIIRHLKFKNEFQELTFAEAQIVVDLLLLSFIVHFSGGIGNPFFFLYIVQVIFSGILFPGFVLPYVNALIAALLLTIWTLVEHVNPAGSYNLRNEPISLSLIITSLAAFYVINFAGIYIINNFMMSYRSLKENNR